MRDTAKHSRTIFLIGFSGSGKSSIGKLLAANLHARFYDTDTLIVRMAGKSISALISEDGEKHFRELERKAIIEVISRRGKKVVALGGGAFQSTENRQMIRFAGVAVYLVCSQAELYRRLRDMQDRPLLHRNIGSASDLKSRIKMLLAKRVRHYNQADMTFSTTGKTIKTSARELKRRLDKLDV